METIIIDENAIRHIVRMHYEKEGHDVIVLNTQARVVGEQPLVGPRIDLPCTRLTMEVRIFPK